MWLFAKQKKNIEPQKEIEPKKHDKKEEKEVWVLSIDGGGIKGLIATYVLRALEVAIQERGGDKPLAHYFDLIAGTSTGGLISLCLSKKEPLTANQIKNLYLQKNEIFFPTPKRFLERLIKEKYSPEPMEAFLKEIFKDDTFEDTHSNVLLTSYDIENTHIFNMSKADTPKLKLRHAARATTAAPTYYPPLYITVGDKNRVLIDGGVYSNNPVLWAYAKARREFPNSKINILSIGNFKKNVEFETELTSFSWFDVSKGNLPIYTLCQTSQENNADNIARLIPDCNYIRIEYRNEKEDNIKMDDISSLTLNRLSIIGKQLSENYSKLIDDVAVSLVKKLS